VSKAAPMQLTMKKGQAAPVAVAAAPPAMPQPVVSIAAAVPAKTATADLVPLSFKVPKSFDKAFRQAALDGELKLNELLFECFKHYQAASGKNS
jgi:hypothetical protein